MIAHDTAEKLSWTPPGGVPSLGAARKFEAPRTDAISAPPVAILGIAFDHLTLTQAVAEVQAMIASGRPHHLVTANLDFLMQAFRDVELRRIMLDADRVLCDGTPLLWASQLFNNPLPERVAGADLVPALLREAADRGYRPFFLGGAPEVAAQAVAKVKIEFPRLDVAGYYSPPVRKLLEMNHAEIVRRIRASHPDLLFVSFGCPKAEKWIAMHYRKLGVPVTVGVGATIDFLAGRVRRAPAWMQRTGVEWVHRLVQEPGRLGQRYVKDLGYFLWKIPAQWWRLQFRLSKKSTAVTDPARYVEPVWSRLALPEHLDRDTVQANRSYWQEMLERHCLLELDRVEFMDSTGLAFLLQLQKKLRAARQELVLLAPSATVRRTLRWLRLEDFFLMAADAREARELIGQKKEEPSGSSCFPSSGPSQPWLWRGEITAGNAREFWKATLPELRAACRSRKEVTVDLSELRFIDSTGAGLLVRAKKEATQSGVRLRFDPVHPNVRNVIRLLQLDRFLFDPVA